MRAVTGSRWGIFLALVALLLTSHVAFAADGSIRVTVRESGGEEPPILGATIVLEKEDGSIGQIALQTDENGQTFFPTIEEGSGYKITAAVPGLFAAQVKDDIVVVAGQTSNVTFGMIPEIVETIDVVGEKDLIDIEETTEITTISDDFFSDLPVLGREYQQVLKLAPGFTDFDGDGNPNVHGARDTDFRMEVDGVSNQDPLTGTFSSFINPDAIEEIQIVDVGVDGRSGGAIGGFGRIRLKEGGNDFNGTFNFIFQDSAFTNDGAGGRDPLDFGRIQPSVFLSGPVIKDHLTFVVSHEYIKQEEPFGIVGGRGDFVRDFESTRNLDRLTWRASASNKISLTYQSDPFTLEPSEASSIVPPDSSSNVEASPEVFSLQWSATPSPTFQLETTVAFRDNNTTEDPFKSDVVNDCIRADTIFLTDPNTDTQQCSQVTFGNLRSGTYRIDQEIDNSTWTYRADATQFVDDFIGGNHSLSFGISIEQNEYERDIEIRNSWQLFGSSSSAGGPSAPTGPPGTIGGGFGDLGQVRASILQTLFAPKANPVKKTSPIAIRPAGRNIAQPPEPLCNYL